MRDLEIQLAQLFECACGTARNDFALFVADLIFDASRERGNGGACVIDDDLDIRHLRQYTVVQQTHDGARGIYP